MESLSAVPFPNPRTQFGQPDAPARCVGGRRGVIGPGKAKLRQMRTMAKLHQAVNGRPEPWQGDALRLFQEVYSDPAMDINTRLLAGRYAASYERATLSAVATVTQPGSSDGLARRLDAAIVRAGRAIDIDRLALALPAPDGAE